MRRIRLVKIEIEAITEDDVHYILTYSTKSWWSENTHTVYVVHSKFHSLLHHTISGGSLAVLLSHSLMDVVHAKLMLIIEQGKDEYIFK